MHDQDRVVRPRLADGVVMQRQIRQCFAVVELEIVNRVVAFHRGRKFRRQPNHRNQERPKNFEHNEDYFTLTSLLPVFSPSNNPMNALGRFSNPSTISSR